MAISHANSKGTWYWVRKAWITLGLLAMLGFVSWSFFAYQASDNAKVALVSDGQITVTRGADYWLLIRFPVNTEKIGVVFFPGALVEPSAYGPLLRDIALAGYPVLLIELPNRGAFGGANGTEVLTRAKNAMMSVPNVSEWVITGHSRGGAVAARFVLENNWQTSIKVSGLVLVGTSHPRDFSLAGLTVLTTKILGSRDGVASVQKSENNRHLLPAHTRWVVLEGANHSQFGWYGFQPLDHFATIDRNKQQELTSEAIVAVLNEAASKE